MPGKRISAIKHAVCCCSSDFRNSSAQANARAGNPTSFMKPCRALRTDSSSSTIATILGLSSVAMLPKEYSGAGIHAIMLWYRVGDWAKVYFAGNYPLTVGNDNPYVDYRLGGVARYYFPPKKDINMRVPDQVLKCVVFI